MKVIRTTFQASARDALTAGTNGETRTRAPGPDSRFPLGAVWALHRDPLGFLAELTRRYGDIVQLRWGSRHYVLVNHPDHIRQVLTADKMFRSFPLATKCLLGNGLLTSQGALHRRQRQLMNPMFRRQRPVLDTIVAEAVENAMRRWRSESSLDVAQEMQNLTFEIIAKTLFGRGSEEKIAALLDSFSAVVRLTERNKTPLLDKLLGPLPLPSNLRYRRAVEHLNRIVGEAIRERKTGDLGGTDLLSALLKAQQSLDRACDLPDRQIHDEIMTLLLAGHETTSNALTWIWYLLSQNPGAEAQLHGELESVLQGKSPAAEDLPRLSYTRMVFLEALRLYPPVWLISRRPMTDLEIGGYRVPAWSSVNMSPYLMHRDARYFPDPDRFDPLRWLPEQVSGRPRFSYLPFGGGAHYCIGEDVATTEALLITAAIAQKWQLKLERNHPVRLDPLITLRPKHGMMMTLHARPSRAAEGLRKVA